MSALDGLKLRRCRTTALLLALIITSKRTYSDTIAQRMRTRPMHLPTEMVRAFLPPRSIGTGRVVSTAVLEPTYELGGDADDATILMFEWQPPDPWPQEPESAAVAPVLRGRRR
ncbi:hypothetical protein ABZ402_47175 [Streptomyces mirabilis]